MLTCLNLFIFFSVSILLMALAVDQQTQSSSETTKLILISYEFLQETVFSGNGVLSRSVATSILLENAFFPRHEIFVICASPVHDKIQIVSESSMSSSQFSLLSGSKETEYSLQILVIPVQKWKRLDWESDYALFAQSVQQFLSTKSDERTVFIDFYRQCRHLVFIDYTGYFVAKHVLSMLSPNLLHAKLSNTYTSSGSSNASASASSSSASSSNASSANNSNSGSLDAGRPVARRRGSIEIGAVPKDDNNTERKENASAGPSNSNVANVAKAGVAADGTGQEEVCYDVAELTGGVNDEIKVFFLNFRVFHNNSNFKKDERSQERLFYIKWESESTRLADATIALNGDECKILLKLFLSSYAPDALDFGEIDKLGIDDVKDKFYSVLGDKFHFSAVHPPLRAAVEQISLRYWNDVIAKYGHGTKPNVNVNKKDSKQTSTSTSSNTAQTGHASHRSHRRQSSHTGMKKVDVSHELMGKILDKRQYLLCFSRISREKNIDIFVDLIENLGQTWFEKNGIVPYLIGSANDKEYYDHLRARIKAANIKCLMDNFMPVEQLAKVLMKTKLNVHTSISEPYGMTICEAAAFGVASMVNKDGIGAVELLKQDGVFLSSMTNGTELAQDVKKYLNQAQRAKYVDTAKNAMERSLGYGLDASGNAYKVLMSKLQ